MVVCKLHDEQCSRGKIALQTSGDLSGSPYFSVALGLYQAENYAFESCYTKYTGPFGGDMHILTCLSEPEDARLMLVRPETLSVMRIDERQRINWGYLLSCEGFPNSLLSFLRGLGYP